MASDNRRYFLGKMAALAALPVAGRAAPRIPALGSRPEQALHLREAAAAFQSRQVQASHPTNGDESSLPNYIGNFCKGLPHTQLGEVETSAYQSLLTALAAGTQNAMEGIERGSGVKLVDPLAGLAFQMEGQDSHCLGVAAPPAFASAAAADEMVELYWQALARDVPFTDYDTNPITAAAAGDLSKLSAFQGPPSGGQVTTGTLFRGAYNGGLNGPFVSQFFWQPVPLNSTYTPQMFREPMAGVDYLNNFSEWLALQTGVPPFITWTPDPQLRYIHDGRSLAEWVHYDFLYQAYHNAALILLDQSPDTVLNTNPYLNPANPYKSTKVETGFATFGAPHICCILGTVTAAALYAAWFQKWMVHRRLRPEEFGGRLHQTKTGAAQYPIHADLLNSAALPMVFAANGSYLLPQSYPEGAPLHPSYPQGHSTVAGACSAMLKAFFDETQIVTNCVVASGDGLSLNPYTGPALTVGGEINKLAFNVAIGRNFAGIHYRTDAEAGFLLGEQVAIAILQDMVNTYAEDFSGFQLTLMDGTPVTIATHT
jgi:membrane-associated phospholipid phosphatase